MPTQLACVLLLLLGLACGGLCAGVDQEQRALEDDLLGSLFTSKMNQNRQSAPYWRVSLTSVCRLVSSLQQEAWSTEEQEDGRLTEASLRLLEELYSLQHVCRVLQGREQRLLGDSAENLENSEAPLKRKSPYILKRQAAHSTKSRRPYILKRGAVY